MRSCRRKLIVWLVVFDRSADITVFLGIATIGLEYAEVSNAVC